MITIEAEYKPGQCPHPEGHTSRLVFPNADRALAIATTPKIHLLVQDYFYRFSLGDLRRLEIWAE